MPGESARFLLSMWAEIESAGVRAVLMRNYDDFPEKIRGDHDVLVHPDDLERVKSIVFSVARSARWRVLFVQGVSNHYQVVLWYPRKASQQGPDILQLDLQNALGWKGFHFAAAEPFLRDPVRLDGVSVPNPEARTVALAIHSLLDKGTVRDQHREAMRRDAAAGLEEFSASVLPPRAARMVCEWIRVGAPE